jgi:hypothetical protein
MLYTMSAQEHSILISITFHFNYSKIKTTIPVLPFYPYLLIVGRYLSQIELTCCLKYAKHQSVNQSGKLYTAFRSNGIINVFIIKEMTVI